MKSCYKIFVWIAFICLPSMVFSQSFTLIDIVSGTGSSSPQNLTSTGSLLFFTATTPALGRELWKSNGTTTSNVVDLNPGTGGNNTTEMVSVGTNVYFNGTAYAFAPNNLWQSDGTTTQEIFASGFEMYNVSSLVNFNGTLFFAGNPALDPSTPGVELYKVTSPGNALLVKDTHPSDNGNPTNLTPAGSILFFVARNATDGYELWKTTGAAGNGSEVMDINPGPGDAFSNLQPSDNSLVSIGSTLYFTANDGTNGKEVWKTDGTTTVMLENINTNAGAGSSPRELTNVNGTLYFSADPGTGFPVLWKSDGTPGNAVQVTGSFLTPTNLKNVNGILYFSAFDLTGNGIELFKTDPSLTSATLVKDINPGNPSSSPVDLVGFGSTLLFSADDGNATTPHGRELWKSLGTAGTTDIAQDIEAGSASSNPDNITFVGVKGFLTATTAAAGTELYVDLTSFVALPVTSLEFKGRLVQNSGLLEWKTTSETNTAVFIVERSLDGRSYAAVGNVSAAGSTNTVNSYQFTDPNITTLGAAILYYRLLQKDVNGHFTYSRILAIPVNSKNVIVSLYPNPVTTEANLMISIARDEKLVWRMMDNTGHIVKQNTQILSAGSTSIGINVEGLAKGIYFIDIQSQSLQKMIRLVKN